MKASHSSCNLLHNQLEQNKLLVLVQYRNNTGPQRTANQLILTMYMWHHFKGKFLQMILLQLKDCTMLDEGRVASTRICKPISTARVVVGINIRHTKPYRFESHQGKYYFSVQKVALRSKVSKEKTKSN